MKKLILISFCIAQSLLSFGQYFNKSIEEKVNVIGSLNIEQINNTPDTFLVFGAGILNGKLNIQSFRINASADTILNYVYKDSLKQYYLGWANSTNFTNDLGYIMGGGVSIDTFDYGYLVKYDTYGDTLWTKEFGDTIDFYTFRQAMQAHDGGYVAVGESSYPSGTYSDGWLLKTDSVGNKEWERFYGQLSQTERLTSVYPTTDGGYILGGGRRHFAGSPPRHNLDPMIVKVDSMGAEEWTYIYDTPYNEAVAYVIQTMDGNYVFGGSISVSQNGTTGNGNARATLFKVDTAGSLMWTKSFGFVSSNHGFQVVKELPDSSLIAVGRRREVTSSLIKGLMVKTDQNGDSIFVQTYENDPNGIDNQNYLWDVTPMDDGGFMAAGEVLGVPPSVPFRQDAWVIRVDSMGCIISNCLVGNESLKMKDERLKLFPNPTQGQINLESTEELQSIEVYNLQGQKVQEINPKERSWELPEQSGLYLIRLQDEEGNIYTEKVIRQ